MSLGVKHLDEIAGRITALMNFKAPGGLFDKLKMLPQLGALTTAIPKTVTAKDAPCKEVILKDNFDLNAFPDPQVLAPRRRPLHHPALRPYTRSRIRQAQHRHVPHAGLRRPDHRHALAAPESRRRTLSQCHASAAANRIRSQPKDCAASPPWPSPPAALSPFPTAPSAACRRSPSAISKARVSKSPSPSAPIPPPPSPPSFPPRPKSRSS